MNSFKRIIVLGDRMTGKTQFVNSIKNEDAFVVDDPPPHLTDEQIDEYLSDKYNQSILVLQYPYNIPELTGKIDCIVLFKTNGHICDELQNVFNVPTHVVDKSATLNVGEYMIYDTKKHTYNL